MVGKNKMTRIFSDFADFMKPTADWLSVGIAWATIFKLLPPIAAAFTIVWTGIQIYEWWKKRNARNVRDDKQEEKN